MKNALKLTGKEKQAAIRIFKLENEKEFNPRGEQGNEKNSGRKERKRKKRTNASFD